MLTLAATVGERATELISEGWVKGRLYDGVEGVQNFCVHGAVNFALEEMFGPNTSPRPSHIDGHWVPRHIGATMVHDLLVAYLVDEAKDLGFETHSLFNGVARFNDLPETTHEQIVGMMQRASARLWAAALAPEETQVSWAETVDERPTHVHVMA